MESFTEYLAWKHFEISPNSKSAMCNICLDILSAKVCPQAGF